MNTDSPAPSSVRATLDFLLTLAGPVGLVGVLLYYVGVIDSRSYFEYFSIDDASLGYGLTDYAARSADALLPSLALAAIAVMLFFFFHVLARQFPRVVLAISVRVDVVILLLTLAGAFVLTGALGLALAGNASGWRVAFPLASMAAVLMIESASTLAEAKIPVQDQPPARRQLVLPPSYTHNEHVAGLDENGRAKSMTPARRAAVIVAVLLSGLVVLAANTADRAKVRAATDGANLDKLPPVALFSEKELSITGPGVSAQKLAVIDAKFQFRYTGLRLLAESNKTMILLPKDWRLGAGNAIILHPDSSMRLDFLSQ